MTKNLHVFLIGMTNDLAMFYKAIVNWNHHQQGTDLTLLLPATPLVICVSTFLCQRLIALNADAMHTSMGMPDLKAARRRIRRTKSEATAPGRTHHQTAERSKSDNFHTKSKYLLIVKLRNSSLKRLKHSKAQCSYTSKFRSHPLPGSPACVAERLQYARYWTGPHGAYPN